MATLDDLKQALRGLATARSSSLIGTLSDSEYSVGFDALLQGAGLQTYRNFINPQLSLLLSSLNRSRTELSVLEIGPGPKSVLESLSRSLKMTITRYAAFEPNEIFASKLKQSLNQTAPVFPCLMRPPSIYGIPFALDDDMEIEHDTALVDSDEMFDMILFCHSMYSMKPKRRYVEKALTRLREQPSGAIVVVFHRDQNLQLDSLVCHRTASFPLGAISVKDSDDALSRFAAFITGCALRNGNTAETVRSEWRELCRRLGSRDESYPGQLLFSSPEIMVTFTRHATTLPDLITQVPTLSGDYSTKNREARMQRPAAIVQPTEILHVQRCIRWALEHDCSLVVVGGGHGDHCLRSNVVAIDMGAFNQVHIVEAAKATTLADGNYSALAVVEAGCKTGDIIRKTLASSFTVPLGSRPSVGAGLWLQGGIGHLARLHGLACDAIIGATVVSVASGQIFCVGHVPSQHQPVDGICPDNDTDLMWAIRGGGTNFGIVISITFKVYPARLYSTRTWTLPLSDHLEAQLRLNEFDRDFAGKLDRNWSADAYLYCEAAELRLGVTLYESHAEVSHEPPTVARAPVDVSWSVIRGSKPVVKIADGVQLFEAEMYMSSMHGGHGGGKTSAFKRCLFLKRIGDTNVAKLLVAAIQTRPSPLCYLHLLQGGGAVNDVINQDSAFGCRGWLFACVITGVWRRNQDGSAVARAAVQWVYDTVKDLLPLSVGVYGADLGPDPRDAALAAQAFGPNLPRLGRLKQQLDPANVLAHACPLPRRRMGQKLIILVTGESCAGKDYAAHIWASVFINNGLTARVVSISDETKREYAAVTGADLDRLLWRRAYKEQHRKALTDFFQERLRVNPRLPETHFLNIVHDSAETEVLVVTGMRDQAPVATFSPCAPHSKLVEVNVRARKTTRLARREDGGVAEYVEDEDTKAREDFVACPCLVFDNDVVGPEAAERFCEDCLLPLCSEDLQRLADMVSKAANFPRPGIEFHHVLDIAQQPGGLNLCISLLRSHFNDWANVDVLACCETGGFIFASALAAQVNVPLALVREAGKLPAPIFTTTKSPSHISSSSSVVSSKKKFELGQHVIPRNASVLVVDDVLATGETVCAMLRLLKEAGVRAENTIVMVVAEFPFHRGRELLRQHGFGGARVQSLLVFGGA